MTIYICAQIGQLVTDLPREEMRLWTTVQVAQVEFLIRLHQPTYRRLCTAHSRFQSAILRLDPLTQMCQPFDICDGHCKRNPCDRCFLQCIIKSVPRTIETCSCVVAEIKLNLYLWLQYGYLYVIMFLLCQKETCNKCLHTHIIVR